MSTLTQSIIAIVKSIPRGKVATYGQVAQLAGSPLAARVVVWVLNSSSEKEDLPWHRVINSKGMISLPRGGGYELQKSLLQSEGIEFDDRDRISFRKFLFDMDEATCS